MEGAAVTQTCKLAQIRRAVAVAASSQKSSNAVQVGATVRGLRESGGHLPRCEDVGGDRRHVWKDANWRFEQASLEVAWLERASWVGSATSK